jgi:hypothetical protein
MYQVIIRKADKAVMDCRPKTPSIQAVLTAVVSNEQLRGNAAAKAEDYEITLRESPVEVWRDPAVVLAEKWAAIRTERNRRLTECDWTQLADSPLDVEAKAAWAAFRHALRDVPQTYADPDQVVWPEPPE